MLTNGNPIFSDYSNSTNIRDLVGDCWYTSCGAETKLNQGDQIWGLEVPYAFAEVDGALCAQSLVLNGIVLTQSCDLQHNKVDMVLVAPMYAVSDWVERNPNDLLRLEDIRQGYDASLYLLPAWPGAAFHEAKVDRIVDLSEIRSVDRTLLNEVCAKGIDRIGLRSPEREHLAQAVARAFMRVGLPRDIPSFELEKAGSDSRIVTVSAMAPILGAFELGLLKDLPIQQLKRRRSETAEVYFLLRTNVADPAIMGAGFSAEQAERSLARQISVRWNRLQVDDRYSWLRTFVTSSAVQQQ